MLFLNYYGVQYFQDYHRIPTTEVLAKIYHCGYKGFKRKDARGRNYWRKIRKAMEAVK